MVEQPGKAKILDAALHLFAEQGFHKTSVAQIAQTAGVSKGLTYNYFKSKEALLVAIIDHATERISQVATPLVIGQADGGYEPSLRRFLDGFAVSLRTHRTYLTFQLSLLFQPDLAGVVRHALSARATHLLETCEALFRAAGVEKPHWVARRFLAEIDGIALHYLSVFEDYPLETMLAHVYDNYQVLSP